MAIYFVLLSIVVLLGYFVNNREYLYSGRDHKNNNNQNCVGKRPKSGRIECRNRQQNLNLVLAAAIFCLLAGVSACRIAVGNDYWVYRDNFNLIMQGRYVSYEWGFQCVVWLIQSFFGYDSYLPVFGFFSIVTCYFFVKSLWGQAEWFAASVYLLLTGGYYFNSLNSVRYYLALAIALFSMKYVINKEFAKFFFIILAGACFHKSVLAVIPIYILARWLAGKRLNRAYYIAGGLLAASLIVFQDFYRGIIFRFYPYYENSVFDTGEISYVNIAKCAGTLFLCILFYRKAIKDNERYRFYFNLNLAGILTYTFGSFIPEISRIGYYMIVSQIFLIPGVLLRIENRKIRRFFIICTALAFMAYFFLYLRSAYDTSVRVLPYRNWIFD